MSKDLIPRMSSEMLGISTSEVEIAGISARGVWLLAGKEKLFLSCEDFPWFKNAPVGENSEREGTNSRSLLLARPGR